jgi:uncharacterized RDD family membrane protein YckC/Tfp pilus assembly major pilin PilA
MPQYFVADHGVSRGPFTLAQISENVRSGEITAFTLMWTEGMADWDAAQQVLADTGLFQMARSTQAATPTPKHHYYTPIIASFGRRIAATLIDALVMFIPVTILIALPRAFLPDSVALAVGEALALLACLAYFTVLQGRARGATIGKNALDIRVVRNDGSKLGDGLAMGRYVLLTLFSFLLLPCLAPLFNRHRKGLHDLICGTVVIEGKSAENPEIDLTESSVGDWGSLTWVMVSLMFMIPFATGVIAAVSIPAYQDYVIRSRVAMAIEQARDASEKVVAYHSEHGHWPNRPEDIGLPNAAQIANVATLQLDRDGTVALKFTADLISGRALHIHIGEDGHRQCTTNLPRKYTDRACSRATLSPSLASAQPTM